MPGNLISKSARWLAVAATIGMFLVLMMGATVTNTGSAEGCGRSWPLCHGEFIPEFAVETAIEYGHRLVTGVEGILIAALAVVGFVGYRQRIEMRVLVPVMIFFLLLQSGLGAAAVLWPQHPAVMALHFGISLTAFASTLLAAVFIRDLHGAEVVRDRPLPPRFRAFAFGTLGYTYVLVYIGAYVRRANANLACGGWPLCNGEVFPGFSGPVGIAFAHRLAALVGGLLLVALVVWAFRFRAIRPDIFRGSVAALVLIVAQSLSGAFVVWSELNVFTTISHGGIATLLFGSLSYVCYQAIPRPAGAEAPVTAEAGSSRPATRPARSGRARPARPHSPSASRASPSSPGSAAARPARSPRERRYTTGYRRCRSVRYRRV